jgi:hypothetical protein
MHLETLGALFFFLPPLPSPPFSLLASPVSSRPLMVLYPVNTPTYIHSTYLPYYFTYLTIHGSDAPYLIVTLK